MIRIEKKEDGLPISIIVPLSDSRKEFFENMVLPLLRNSNVREIIINDDNGNAPKKRNDGFRIATQPFIFFCDDDILLPINYIDTLYNNLVQNQNIGFTYTNYHGIVLHRGNHGKSENFVTPKIHFNIQQLLLGNYISTMCLLRSSIFTGFDEDLTRFQDWDLWLTIAKNGHNGMLVPDLTFYAYYLDRGISSSTNREESLCIIREKHKLPAPQKNETSNKLIRFRYNTFVMRNIVDYDMILVVSSFDRYEKLCNILEQLFSQEHHYTFKIIIINDGSNDIRYNEIKKLYPLTEVIHKSTNNGKRRYWSTLTDLLQQAATYKSHATVQIDDDFILCSDFVDKLMDLFFKVKKTNNNFVAIYFHYTEDKDRTTVSIDGGTLFDSYFLDGIDNKIPEIPTTRWDNDKNLSSGVWGAISSIIQRNRLLVHKTEHSYIKHDGNDDSKMHGQYRLENKIFTKKFIDE